MVPETGVGADHNWPQRMTMTTTNVEILRQGWLDAASALAPGLETLPESLENGLDAAVVDERLDEQSLLRVVDDVASAAADSLPAEELYFLTRRLQRAVYEYLLSLDALPEPPARRDSNGHGPADTSLIGAEEVAALGRNGATKTKDEHHHALETVARSELTPEPHNDTQLERQPELKAAPSAEDMEAGLAELDAQLTPDDSFFDTEVEAEATSATEESSVEPVAAEADAETAEPKTTRPAFTLFRRTGAKATQPAAESNGKAPLEAEATPAADAVAESNGHATAATENPASNDAGAAQANVEPDGEESFVAPRDGFHLSDLADFAAVQRAPAQPAPAEAAVEEPVATVAEEEPAQPEAVAETEVAPAQEAPNGAAARGWRLRDDEVDQAQDTASDRSAEDDRFETDPEVVEARLEINDRLRRRRCDEAAALLQRLANDVGGRALAELALDAGDRCRALGKGNAALSCYLAASRADPVHETPLLRLADICIDDHDIDLAVSYLERVTRLRRLRNDDKGALKLYRKIVTIAPYRDDILAMLMRAQANGRFDE
jgi:hypothetical protein